MVVTKPNPMSSDVRQAVFIRLALPTSTTDYRCDITPAIDAYHEVVNAGWEDERSRTGLEAIRSSGPRCKTERVHLLHCLCAEEDCGLIADG